MNDEVKHTPTPWEVSGYGAFETLIRASSGDGNGRKVAATWISDARAKRRDGETTSDFYERSRALHLKHARANEANAAHIVKCVNLHDELVEALKVAVEEIKDLRHFAGNNGAMIDEDSFIKWIEALKKAGVL